MRKKFSCEPKQKKNPTEMDKATKLKSQPTQCEKTKLTKKTNKK